MLRGADEMQTFCENSSSSNTGGGQLLGPPKPDMSGCAIRPGADEIAS